VKWFKAKPREDGYYWMKTKDGKLRIVQIWDAPGDPTIAFCGTDMDKPYNEIRAALFYGPLSSPEE
jgi:hypothetical protein